MPLDREVAGLTCAQVLDGLSDYIDGQLTPAQVAAVEAHVRGCNACERFGGAFSETMRALRQRLAAPPVPLPGDVAARLLARLGGR